MSENTANREGNRAKLLSEKKRLEEALAAVGRRNPDNKGDWEAVAPDNNGLVEGADKNIAADMIEGFEEQYATEGGLEQRLASINEALARIDNGDYGVCSVCGNPIEEERLAANPAATTCVTHRND